MAKCGCLQWFPSSALWYNFNYLGMTESDFYTVVFGVSRSLGCLSNGIWARIFGLPIERPNSIDLDYI